MKTFLALYMATPRPDGGKPDIDDETRDKGMAAWKAWMQRHADRVVDTGGPLGRTKKVGPDGVSDIRNAVTGYVVLKAESHEEAARLFEGHPHFTIFPGESVEVMEQLPIPGA
jgi:hypothetical protein